MSVQTRVLVNGQWTTRTMDIHHILAKNREEESAELPAKVLEENNTPPVMGILTRTITRSPLYNWIIPARIRHKDKNDVVCIGDNFIEIKELLADDGHLQDVITKADFGSTIRTARVFGTARKPAVPGLDAFIKRESEEMELDTPREQEVPPQILVLTLESKELVFLFAFEDGHGQVKFIASHRPLPDQRSYLEQHGKHVAVDPKSRALAVAACEGLFSLYALKSMDQLRRDMEYPGFLDPNGFNPIKEERHLSLDGVILKMEFLYPPTGDDQHVILMLIVSQDNQTRLLWYDWDSSTSLRTAGRLGTFGQPVMKLEQLPLLLIPLTISTAFMLICEKTISVYRDVLTGNATRKSISFHSRDAPVRPGSSRRAPLWTHWARPVRREAHTSKHDDLYICREDGMVRFLEISEESEIMVDASMKAGILGCNIDTAFASLDLGLDRDDLLIAGGDMSDGGLYLFQARQSPEYVQCVPNWAPTIDFITAAVVPDENLVSRRNSSNVDVSLFRDRIFAGAGRGWQDGAVVELRFGLQARMGTTIDLEDSGILRLWTLPDLAGEGLYFLLSHSSHSSLLHLSTDTSTVSGEHDELTGLDFNSTTLAAGATLDGLIIQVTETSVRSSTIVTSKPRFSWSCEAGKIVAATIHGGTSSIVTALRIGDEITMHLGRMVVDDNLTVTMSELGNASILQSEPTCLAMDILGGTLYVFVGTAAGTLQIFRMSLDSGLIPMLEQTLVLEPDPATFAVCESLAVATSGEGVMLVCGLRNGCLEVFHAAIDQNSVVELSLSRKHSITIGTTSVTVELDRMRSNAAFLLCGDEFCRLEFSLHDRDAPTVHRIWLTDRIRMAYNQKSMQTIAQVGSQRHLDTSGMVGSLICISGTELIMATLDDEGGARVVPRRITVGGTPTRLIFSRHLNKLVVGYTKLEVKPTRHTNDHHRSTGKRSLRPTFKVIDPDRDPMKFELEDSGNVATSPSESTRNLFPTGKPGERILGMLEWSPTEANRTYHMVVLSTIVHRSSPPKAVGRMLFFNVRENNEGRVDVKLKHQIKHDKPVYSVAAFGASSLIYCSGNELIVQTLRLPDKKWLRPVKHMLGSPSIHISVVEPFVYVTTARHSLTILKYEDDQLRPQFSDRVARDGMHHLNIPDSNITLVSDKACSVVGLWQPPRRRTESSATTLFEAVLPVSITRLRRGVVSTPWRAAQSSQHEAILGSSADGTFYQFIILSETRWRLLRFIQNMTGRNPLICPFEYLNKPRKHIEPSTVKKHNMHVDGDMLYRLIASGGTTVLRAMLEQEPLPEHRFFDYDSAAVRYERFSELVDDALGEGGHADPVQAAVNFMRTLLQPEM
ncbi:MAG: hypothetical protein M1830_005341 [Pleopsidium flavum]|nr:MAG: hypothetical protein M1830_005341 [Pleopsidium flavum]